MIVVFPALRKFLPLLLLLACAPLAAATPRSDLKEAARLYDAGRYAEARPLLQAAVEAGRADGVTLYRLFYCQRLLGDPAHQETLSAARGALEKELQDDKGFEVAFYLSSTYANLALSEDVRRVAAEVTARFESGKIREPSTPLDQFRLGKLYVDAGGEAGAARWLAKAVAGFAASEDSAFGPYLQWSARWLGERAFAAERYEAAADHFALVASAGQAALPDLDNLALSSLIVGRYPQAIDAFGKALRINPTEANRYRYGIGLAQLAQITPDLPISPDGERNWEETGRAELEELLRAQGEKVRGVRAEINETASIGREERAALQAKLDAPRPLFVAAAIEYTRRGFNLRESAFFGGFAPLLIHTREWSVSQKGGGRGRRMNAAQFKEFRKKQAEERARKPTEAKPKDDD